MGVIVLPPFARVLFGVLLVEADEHVRELASNRLCPEQVRQLRELKEPLRVPRSPVVVVAVDDLEHHVMRLPRLVQELGDLALVHLAPFSIRRWAGRYNGSTRGGEHATPGSNRSIAFLDDGQSNSMI